MKKVAIITLNGYFNYGNRLQNYALQETISSFGFEVETIINSTTAVIEERPTFVYRLNNLLKKGPKEIGKAMANKINKSKLSKGELNEVENIEIEKIRTKIFKGFTYEYIKETNYSITDNNIPDNLSDKYDYFITGSDQVWNPHYIYGPSIYFLTFVEKHKRIAYAPSFGVSEIECKYIDKYKEWISGINKLSVREDDGAKIIKELSGKEAPVLVDPTLLLTKEKWLSISKVAINKPIGEYLLTYFLGGIPNDYKEQISRIVKENNLEIINLGDITEKDTYKTGPSEFIDYINSCSVFCTDSFHGAVFSILFEKPFIVYERMGTPLSMFSRINTLLDKFKLESRKSEYIKSNKDIFDIDYLDVQYILEAERKKSFEYLKDALNITNEAKL